MKNTMILFLLAGIMFQIPAYSQEKAATPEVTKTHVIIDGVEPGKFTQDYDAAIKYSKEKGLPTLIIFTGSDWCGWCKIMDKNVFSKPEWTEYAKDKLVQIWIDFPKKNLDLVPEKYRKRNDELSQKYGIRGYPTYIVLDSNGTKLGQLNAGRDKTPESFIKELQKVLMMTTEGMKQFCAGLKPEDARKVMTAFASYTPVAKQQEELSAKLKAVQKSASEKKIALDEAILNAKLNIMSPEKKAEYEAAQTALAKAQQDLQAWMQINAKTRPTPELRQEFSKLRKALSDAMSKAKSF